MQVNIHEAKTNLSRLIERAQMGEEVLIAKAGRPMVKLVKVEPRSKRIFGSAKGQIVFHEGWDAPMTDKELEAFLGESPSGYKRLPLGRGRRKGAPVSAGRRRDRG